MTQDFIYPKPVDKEPISITKLPIDVSPRDEYLIKGIVSGVTKKGWNNDWYVMSSAAHLSSPDYLKTLVEEGGNLFVIGGSGATILHDTTSYDTFVYILDQVNTHYKELQKQFINTVSTDGSTALTRYCQNNKVSAQYITVQTMQDYFKVLSLFLENGADLLQSASSGYYDNPIEILIRTRLMVFTSYLKDTDSDKLKEYFNSSSFYDDYKSILGKAIENGFDINAKYYEALRTNNPITSAARFCDITLFKLFKELGAKWPYNDDNGFSAECENSATGELLKCLITNYDDIEKCEPVGKLADEV